MLINFWPEDDPRRRSKHHARQSLWRCELISLFRPEKDETSRLNKSVLIMSCLYLGEKEKNCTLITKSPCFPLTRQMWAEQTATRSSCCLLMEERRELRPYWTSTMLIKRYADDTQNTTHTHTVWFYLTGCAPVVVFLRLSFLKLPLGCDFRVHFLTTQRFMQKAD